MKKLISNVSPQEIQSGNVYKVLVKLGTPLALSEMVQVAYDLANLYWLGRVGKDAVAAPSASWPFTYTFIAAMNGLLASGTTLVSQYRGANNINMMNKSVAQTFVLAIISSLIISVSGILTIPYILYAAGIPSDVYPLSVVYSRIMFVALIFISLWESFRAVVSASGNTITPMKYNFFGVGLNMIFDPFLILGIGPFPMLGVAGAGISTLISRAIVAFISLNNIIQGKSNVRLIKSEMKIDKNILKMMVKIGTPLSVAWVMEALGFSILTAIISMEGSTALAAWGIGDRPLNLLNFATIGFINATGIMVGQSLGASNRKRAEESAEKSLMIISLIGVIGGLIFGAFGRHIASFFIQDPDVIEATTYYYIYMGSTIVFFYYIQLMGAIAQGSGHTRFVMVVSILRIWIIRNVLAYIFGPGPLNMGIPGIWIGMSLSNIISGLVALIWIFKADWKKGVIKK
ncbi:MATE family efflux transporter [Fervidicoccus sp.]|uniref:MATE family efflux transporter n=1 Tax=Fervidicoccus sp. TaxID=2060324 RepID=UPI003D0C42D1